MTQARPHDQASGLKHLPHAWATFGAEVPKHDHSLLTLVDGA
jgi:hypothetical protein